MTDEASTAAGPERALQRLGDAFMPSHRVVRSEARTGQPVGRLYLLHGFFGSGRNWSAIARGVVRARPDWDAVLVDLRLHGESRGAQPPHTVQSCGADVARLAAFLPPSGGPSALLGHSFGGKVALSATGVIDPPCAQTWVIDSTPSAGATAAGAQSMMRLLTQIPGPFESRRAGADAVEQGGFPRFVAEWMATNLVRTDDGFEWRFDMAELHALLTDFFRTDAWNQVENPPDGCEVRFVRATRDSILSESDASRIERMQSEGHPVQLDALEGGHWLNMDNPDGLIALIRAGLPRV